VQNPSPDWWVKIADFGSSKRAVEGNIENATLFVGTLDFLSPEAQGIRSGDDPEHVLDDASYTPTVDMWALGEITHRMITACPVFGSRMELYKYVDRKILFPIKALEEQSTSEDCYSFIKNIMTPSPRHRLTSRVALSHPWVASYSSLSNESGASSTRFVILLHCQKM
jgi:calcium/calmodulin-dependent protein kinase I